MTLSVANGVTLRTLILNLFLALGYAALGVALLNTGLHEQIVPLWLPAGLGLAAVLKGGLRYLPGIGLGSLTANILIPALSTTPDISHVITAAMIASGAMLQTALAAHLINRFEVNPLAPKRERWMLLYLLYGGLLTCTINATVGTLSVTFINDSSGSLGLLLDWLSWWLGDSFGVILGTPLFLSLFSLANRKQGRGARLLPLRLSGILLAALVVNQIYLVHLSGLLQTSFRQDAQLIEARIQSLVQKNLSELMRLGQELTKTTDLTPQQFAKLVGPALESSPGLRAYSWDPLVKGEDRAAFERETAQLLEMPEYAIYGGPIQQQDMLIPVQFVEPLRANRTALGFNLYSREDRRRWVLLAQTQGQAVATGILNLTQAPDEPGLLLLQPVYRFVGGNDLLASSRELKGFIVGVFTVSQLLEAAMQHSGVQSVYLRASEPGAEPFFQSQKAGINLPNMDLNAEFNIQLAQQTWELEAFAGTDYLAAHPISQAMYLQVLLVGISCLGSLLVLSMYTREQLLEARVRQKTQELSWQARHDDLTRLQNRKGLHESLVNRVEDASPFGLLFLDLDRFKLINDSLGHQVGDHLLQRLSAVFLQSIGPTSEIYRMGGDEFILLVPGDAAAATAEAETLLEIAARTYAVDEHRLQLTASIGISLFPSHGRDLESLIQHADTAMYRAKSLGKNRYELYSEELTTDARYHLEVEQDLRQALKSNQFVLHYQPQFNLEDEQLCGYEALVRWQHPELGLLGPDKFIPVAEETQLIVPLGWQIIDSVCRRVERWLRDGIDVPMVAINISPQQLLQADFIQRLNGLVDQYGLPRHLLELEITESMILKDPDFVIQQLQRLRLSGYHLALDDFGTGYSSLDRIKYLPLHRIKIDKSFTRDIGRNPKDEAVIISAIALGRSLGVEVLAEGVETEAQCDFLRRHECNSAQGYLFGKPVPPEVVSQCAFKKLG
ncbi:bifunctional diguanylate cyclase/phosphodiesterase [Marinobacterium stanieri]|uniref:Diguanylate cyclase (GGDEF) domain-containing protein n=1 Tax=Marinobacterium stanieri TaxID=49186 RepID=A0A1N6N6D4_9GAMM|nr:EAL domain-containing protein [Marinobacterium stanieri]SIP87591.1 diguanylate cyclase (GGDEF) domain-containing protein [Marinobacterium stanieri]